VCLLFASGAFGLTLTTYGLAGPLDPRYVPYGGPTSLPDGLPWGSYATWWHDGGAPYPPGTLNSDANDDPPNVYPDKNHNVSSWNDVIAPPDQVNSYMRRLDSFNIPTIMSTAPYGSIFGDYVIGEYQPVLDPDPPPNGHIFPEGTQGRPLDFQGDNGLSGLTFTDVKDEMLVQFFSCDKNDGYINVIVNGVSVANIDTWCQGWWYFVLSGLGSTAPNTVTLETRYNFETQTSIPSPHINTLDLNTSSQNWQHYLPTLPGGGPNPLYPNPDDFHIFYIAYNYVETPEPATLTLLGLGLAGSAWLRYAKRRRTK
jgi:hypothetical protein